MSSKKDLEIWVLPKEMVLPLVAAWRTLEKSINPAINFILQCSKCGKGTATDGSQGPTFILSVKKKNDMPVLIGLQCKTEGCTMVVKFEKPISPADPDFPSKLQKYPATALTDPNGKTGSKVSTKALETVTKLLKL